MSEGELKKRLFAKLKTFCVHSPEVDETGEVIDQYIHPSSRATTDEEKKQIVDEAKNDIENEACFEAYSYSLTEAEESIIIPLRIWNKWFDNSEGC